jgi:glycosyltransferase involved in cell wall biosynthesis
MSKPSQTGAAEREAPLVSIVLAAYNVAAMLPETLASLGEQTFRDYELIVINDGSKDSTLGVIEAYAAQDRRVRVLDNGENLGFCTSLNKGLAAARGKYIARIDGDDIALPTRLAKQVAFMEANPEIVMCGTWGEKFGDASGPIVVPTEHEILAASLLFICPFIHPSAMLRSAFLRAHGLRYKVGNKVEDYELWSRIAGLGRVANVPEILLRYRVHGNSMTANSTSFRRGHLRPVMRANILRLLRRRGWEKLLNDAWLDLHGRFACQERMTLTQWVRLPYWLLLLGVAGNNLALWPVLAVRLVSFLRTALRGKLLPPAPIIDD